MLKNTSPFLLSTSYTMNLKTKQKSLQAGSKEPA